MTNSACEDNGCAAFTLDDQGPAESDEAGKGHGSQPTAAETGSAASALACKRTEEKLRAVANRLDRIANAYINSLPSHSDGAR